MYKAFGTGGRHCCNMSKVPPVQLSLFPQVREKETSSTKLELSGEVPVTLSGLQLSLLATSDISVSDLAQAFSATGSEFTEGVDRITLHCRDVRSILQMPGDLSLAPDDPAAAIFGLLLATANGEVAEISLGPDRRVYGSVDKTTLFVPTSAYAALLSCGIPTHGSRETWAVVTARNTFPVKAASISLSEHKSIILRASLPHLVESADIPVLVKVDPTTFEVPLPYGQKLADLPGFIWVGKQPGLPSIPDVNLSGHQVAEHIKYDAAALVSTLTRLGAAVIDYRSGLGRRTLAVTALNSLDAAPALVVTSPAKIWSWQRNLELFGVSYSLVPDSSADVRLCTFNDLASGARFDPPTSLIIDDLTVVGSSVAARRALTRLDREMLQFRVALADNIPSDIEDALSLMRYVKPEEFPAGVDLLSRYQGFADEQASRHIELFCVTRRRTPTIQTGPIRYPRSSVTTVKPTQELLNRAIREAETGGSLSRVREIFSAGLPEGKDPEPSPKVLAVRGICIRNSNSGLRTIVYTRSKETALRLSSSLKKLKSTTHRFDGSPLPKSVLKAQVAIIVFTGKIPPASGFDEAVLMDYPDSFLFFDEAVGPAESPWVDRITVVHMENSIDDRLAALAAMRRARGQTHVLDARDAEWVLESLRFDTES